jgi:type II secretory pathway component PulK
MRQYLTEDRKTKYDTLYECGIALGDEETPEGIFGDKANKLGSGSFSVHYGGAKKTYGLIDEERKININIKSMKVKDYRNIMRRLLPEPEGEELSARDDLITAILHWQGKAAGNINHGPEEHAYEPKKGEFEFIEELLLVKGVTRGMFEDVRDYITVYGDGKVNANTASRRVLLAIIPIEDTVDYVIKGRKGVDNEEGTGDDGWKDISSFKSYLRPKIPSGSDYGKYFTVKSDNFRVVSRGTVGKVESVITCVIGKTAKEKEEAFRYYHEE